MTFNEEQNFYSSDTASYLHFDNTGRSAQNIEFYTSRPRYDRHLMTEHVQKKTGHNTVTQQTNLNKKTAHYRCLMTIQLPVFDDNTMTRPWWQHHDKTLMTTPWQVLDDNSMASPWWQHHDKFLMTTPWQVLDDNTSPATAALVYCVMGRSRRHCSTDYPPSSGGI